MSKHNFGKSVVCPHYKYEDRCKIYCSGSESMLALHTVFSSKEELRTFRKNNCEKRDNACPIAAGLNAKQADETNVEPFTCPHNKFIICKDMECHKCGWNPLVAHMRRMELRKGKSK